jgi:hypothetical protein
MIARMYKEHEATPDRHASRIWWVVGPPHGAVSFIVWLMPYLYPDGVLPVDVGVHSVVPREYTTPMQCEFVEGTCNYDRSGLAAENLWDTVNGMCHTEEEKNEAIFQYLENVFSHEFLMEGEQ